MKNQPIKIFIAYSRNDTHFLNEIRKWFRHPERQMPLKIWCDQEIMAGDLWGEAIEEAINEADIILLLLSVELLASNYFNETELPIILERHLNGSAHAISIILKDCVWESTNLAKFQVLPKDGESIASSKDTNKAYKNILTEIFRVIDKRKNEEESKHIELPPINNNYNDFLDDDYDINDIIEKTETKIEAKADYSLGNKLKKIILTFLFFISVFLLIIFLIYANSNNSNESQQSTIPTFEMVDIPAGTFNMGCIGDSSDCEEKEKPAHFVKIERFYLGTTEVTQAQWKSIMGDSPSEFKGCDNCPVENINWNDAQLFIRSLNKKTGKKYRLPTEEEWEYAAREGGKSVLFGNGKDTITPSQINFNAQAELKKRYSIIGLCRNSTTEVKTFQPNSLGLYDMSGNVWEWCSNGAKDYPNCPSPFDWDGGYYIIRGGAWDSEPLNCRTTTRDYNIPTHRSNNIGFRLCLSPI